MTPTMIAIILKPLGVLFYVGIFAAVKWAAMRVIPEGRVKRLLFRKLW